MQEESVTSVKAEIRREIRARRRQLDPEWIRQTSQGIQQRILALAEWRTTRRICCYLAAPDEVQTDELIAACRRARKQLWVPAWQAEIGRYELARLAPAAALAPGRHGIPEPVAPDWTHPEIIELAIIPGLAFDRRGDRLGHGAGHYDRLLAQAPLKSALKIGLAFAFQLREFVPATARDVAMDGVVTEAEIIWSRTAKKATKVEGRKSKVGSALDL